MKSIIEFFFGKYIRALVNQAVRDEMAKMPFTDFSKADFEKDEKGVIRIKNKY